jgi:hypothetical protein
MIAFRMRSEDEDEVLQDLMKTDSSSTTIVSARKLFDALEFRLITD